MPFDRKTFKDKLQDVLGGALTHFYMVRLAEQNDQTKWVRHWTTEIDRLINMDTVRVLVSAIKGRWDKHKALAEALADVQAADAGYRRVAANYVKKVYRLKKMDDRLPAQAEQEFYDLVQQAAAETLTPDEDQHD